MKNIAVLAGGNSSEFDISLHSAEQVMLNLDRKLYHPYLIIIRGKDWIWNAPDGETYPVDKNDFSLDIQGNILHFDAAFIVIHGSPGEDGKLQSYLDMIRLPYTGCDAFVSSLTFHKFACKLYLEKYHIATPPSVLVHFTGGWTPSVLAGMKYPLFIKPNASGSSFGISKAFHPSEVAQAIQKAFQESEEVIIEEFIGGMEVSCGVLKTATRDMVFPPTEIVSRHEFFDYQAKYSDGLAEEITPARLPGDKLKLIQETASSIYTILGCRGVTRIDFILHDNTPYFLEINTIPGLSKESIIPKQAAAAGMTMKEMTALLLTDLFQ